jgi:hypothetical protein
MPEITEKKPLYFYETYEFKGKLIKPSKGRVDMALTALQVTDESKSVGSYHILVLIYCCLCEQGLLMYAIRDPAKFFAMVNEWRETEVLDEDLPELTRIATAILEASSATKAEPITDPNYLPDPEGN